MFNDFFFELRKQRIPVAMNEWLSLMAALKQGLGGQSLSGFYVLCRALCVKSERLYDAYDHAFAKHFHGVRLGPEIHDQLLDWLRQAKEPAWVDEARQRFQKQDLESLRKAFEERLKQQKERHDGGSHWIGTGGTSPFGNSGFHPDGLRVGGGSGQGMAAQVAAQRRFQSLRGDRVLDTRSMAMALKQLRQLGKDNMDLELDIDGTVRHTAENGGDIDIRWQRSRKNQVKLLLLFDVGGSMTPYTRLCEQLFSAAHGVNHFKAFRYYYFHNCPYDYLFPRLEDIPPVSTERVLKNLDPSWRLMIVGDAAMNPYELSHAGGAIDFFFHNEKPGIEWLRDIHQAVPRSVWLNPEPVAAWDIPSNHMVRQVFTQMYPLTVDGIQEAVAYLNQRGEMG